MTTHDFFPETKLDTAPAGTQITLQMPVMPERIRGLLIPEDTAETIEWQASFGKVIAVAPMAFKNPNNGQEWPDGPMCKVGDVIRYRQNTGQKWRSAGNKRVRFLQIPDVSVLGIVDPEMVSDVLMNMI